MFLTWNEVFQNILLHFGIVVARVKHPIVFLHINNKMNIPTLQQTDGCIDQWELDSDHSHSLYQLLLCLNLYLYYIFYPIFLNIKIIFEQYNKTVCWVILKCNTSLNKKIVITLIYVFPFHIHCMLLYFNNQESSLTRVLVNVLIIMILCLLWISCAGDTEIQAMVASSKWPR